MLTVQLWKPRKSLLRLAVWKTGIYFLDCYHRIELVFFRTPHRGSRVLNLGGIATTVAESVWNKPSKALLESLRGNTLFANELVSNFRELLAAFPIISCFETRATRKLGVVSLKISYRKSLRPPVSNGEQRNLIARQVVERESATLGLPATQEVMIAIDENHSGICKFMEQKRGAYVPVGARITKLVEDGIARSTFPRRVSDRADMTQNHVLSDGLSRG